MNNLNIPNLNIYSSLHYLNYNLPTEHEKKTLIEQLKRIQELHLYSDAQIYHLSSIIADAKNAINILKSINKNSNGTWDWGSAKIENVDGSIVVRLITRVFSFHLIPDVLNSRVSSLHNYNGDIGKDSSFECIPERISEGASLKLKKPINKLTLSNTLDLHSEYLSKENPMDSVDYSGVKVNLSSSLYRIEIKGEGEKSFLTTTDGNSRINKCHKTQNIKPSSIINETFDLENQKNILNKNKEVLSNLDQTRLYLNKLVSDFNQSKEELQKKIIKTEFNQIIKDIEECNIYWNTITVPVEISIGFISNGEMKFDSIITEDVQSRHIDPRPWSAYSQNSSKSDSVINVLKKIKPILGLMLTDEESDLYWDVIIGNLPISTLEKTNIVSQPHIRTLVLVYHLVNEDSDSFKKVMRNKSSKVLISNRSNVCANLISRGYKSLLNLNNMESFGKFLFGNSVLTYIKKNQWIPLGLTLEELKNKSLDACENDVNSELTDEQFELAISGSAALLMLGMIEPSTGRQKTLFKLKSQPNPTDFCFDLVKSTWGIYQIYDILNKLSAGNKDLFLIEKEKINEYIVSGKTSNIHVNNKELRLTLKSIFHEKYALPEDFTLTPNQNPTTDVVTQNPTTDVAVQNPTTDVAIQNPTTDVAIQNPTTDVVTQNPPTDVATQNPTTDVITQNPTTDVITQNPTTGIITQNPTTDVITQNPTTDANTITNFNNIDIQKTANSLAIKAYRLVNELEKTSKDLSLILDENSINIHTSDSLYLFTETGDKIINIMSYNTNIVKKLKTLSDY